MRTTESGGSVTRVLMLFISLVGASSAWAGDLAKPPVFFAISVPNLDASVKWYVESLGLTATLLSPTSQARIAVVRGGGLLVELIQPSKPFSTETRIPRPRERYLERGFLKVGFYVEDLDATVARLKQKGARFMGTVYSDQTVGVRSILVLDNDENLIQLFEPLDRR
jgi:catechol 2,3-dioxygenase-like lactoylglutathione lyase family enzyme